MSLYPDAKRLLEWTEKRVSQMGMEIRQSGDREQMSYYIALLKAEIKMTEKLLKQQKPFRKPVNTTPDR